MPRICKVLIVEDHDGIRLLLGDVFDGAGYRFTLVADGSAMREALENADFDVVLIDVSLRDGEDGFALAKHAADMGCGVILTTADHRHFETVERSGHRYILKPFMVDSLLTVVDDVLKETAARCARRARRHRDAAGRPRA